MMMKEQIEEMVERCIGVGDEEARGSGAEWGRAIRERIAEHERGDDKVTMTLEQLREWVDREISLYGRADEDNLLHEGARIELMEIKRVMGWYEEPLVGIKVGQIWRRKGGGEESRIVITGREPRDFYTYRESITLGEYIRKHYELEREVGER